jgi:nitroimidazol reductase NimA-like FMN-containing flavoprotein (pyridoxamine 5'-phosphate oxidase superfamily)
MLKGQYEEVEEARERYKAIKAFADHFMHLKISEDVLSGDRRLQKMKPVIYRIRIEEITGRIEKR